MAFKTTHNKDESLPQFMKSPQDESILHICRGPTGQARGEKICHVEKFQNSVHETCGES